MSELKLEEVLRGYPQCPHCGVRKPQLVRLWLHFQPLPDEPYGHYWASYLCTSCAKISLAVSAKGNQQSIKFGAIYPSVDDLPADLPDQAETYLKQAIAAIHAPDGAAMLAGSAVDAMLKAKSLTEGSVYSRIDEAVAKGILTEEMAEWAHSVRLGANRPRHADLNEPHTTEAEARMAIDFVVTLGRTLFTLPAAVRRGKAAAKIPS